MWLQYNYFYMITVKHCDRICGPYFMTMCNVAALLQQVMHRLEVWF